MIYEKVMWFLFLCCFVLFGCWGCPPLDKVSFFTFLQKIQDGISNTSPEWPPVAPAWSVSPVMVMSSPEGLPVAPAWSVSPVMVMSWPPVAPAWSVSLVMVMSSAQWPPVAPLDQCLLWWWCLHQSCHLYLQVGHSSFSRIGAWSILGPVLCF